MAQNLELDPTKKDYVLVNGSPVPTDRVLEAVYYSILIPENKWLYGQPGQGSLVYTLENVRRGPSVEQQFASYATDAVRSQVINTGKATQVAVKNLDVSRMGSSNQIDVVPSQTFISDQLDFIPV